MLFSFGLDSTYIPLHTIFHKLYIPIVISLFNITNKLDITIYTTLYYFVNWYRLFYYYKGVGKLCHRSLANVLANQHSAVL